MKNNRTFRPIGGPDGVDPGAEWLEADDLGAPARRAMLVSGLSIGGFGFTTLLCNEQGDGLDDISYVAEAFGVAFLHLGRTRGFDLFRQSLILLPPVLMHLL